MNGPSSPPNDLRDHTLMVTSQSSAKLAIVSPENSETPVLSCILYPKDGACVSSPRDWAVLHAHTRTRTGTFLVRLHVEAHRFLYSIATIPRQGPQKKRQLCLRLCSHACFSAPPGAESPSEENTTQQQNLNMKLCHVPFFNYARGSIVKGTCRFKNSIPNSLRLCYANLAPSTVLDQFRERTEDVVKPGSNVKGGQVVQMHCGIHSTWRQLMFRKTGALTSFRCHWSLLSALRRHVYKASSHEHLVIDNITNKKNSKCHDGVWLLRALSLGTDPVHVTKAASSSTQIQPRWQSSGMPWVAVMSMKTVGSTTNCRR